MSRNHSHPESGTRRHLLQAALKCFARRGYAAASVQEIVDSAKVSKPALYYYFADKAGLFAAVVSDAHDERYRLMSEAAERGGTVAEKLEEILAAIFEFSMRNKELLRLTFATAFAASGEAPGREMCTGKGRRNFDFVRSLIAEGQASGELTRNFSADELAMGIYGQLNTYVMVRLLVPDCPLDRQTARKSVELFLAGARAGGPERGRARSPLRAAADRSNSARDEQQGGTHGVARPVFTQPEGGSRRSASPASREQRTMLTQRDK